MVWYINYQGVRAHARREIYVFVLDVDESMVCQILQPKPVGSAYLTQYVLGGEGGQ